MRIYWTPASTCISISMYIYIYLYIYIYICRGGRCNRVAAAALAFASNRITNATHCSAWTELNWVPFHSIDWRLLAPQLPATWPIGYLWQQLIRQIATHLLQFDSVWFDLIWLICGNCGSCQSTESVSAGAFWPAWSCEFCNCRQENWSTRPGLAGFLGNSLYKTWKCAITAHGSASN